MLKFHVSWSSGRAWGHSVHYFQLEKALEILHAAGAPEKAGPLQKRAAELLLAKDHLSERIYLFLSEQCGFFKPRNNLPEEFYLFSIKRTGWDYDFEYGCDPFAQLLREQAARDSQSTMK